MIFKTKRVEIEVVRGVLFFVRLPLLGQVCWTDAFGWQHDSPAAVAKAEGRR